MNVAILTAGGVGSRLGQEVPKQFLSINDKPLYAKKYKPGLYEKAFPAGIFVCLSPTTAADLLDYGEGKSGIHFLSLTNRGVPVYSYQ